MKIFIVLMIWGSFHCFKGDEIVPINDTLLLPMICMCHPDNTNKSLVIKEKIKPPIIQAQIEAPVLDEIDIPIVAPKVNGMDTDLGSILNASRKNSQNFIDLEKRNKNFLKQYTKDMATIKKLLTDSLDIKSLNQNRDWTVIQRRKDGSVNFYRKWLEYKRGFGNPNGEFFIGLEKLHALTTYGGPYELLIVLEDFSNKTRYAKYDNFVIGSELEKYALKETGRYKGDAGDSFGQHKGMKFTTKDQDNDNHKRNCAEKYKGAWWFDQCYVHKCHLNGPYIHDLKSKNIGIIWMAWHGGHYSMKTVEMMIRPAVF